MTLDPAVPSSSSWPFTDPCAARVDRHTFGATISSTGTQS
jgi:hypothetical protein